jgi:hypothetical protein
VYPKVSGLSHNEIYAYNNKHLLRSNTTKGYGGKTHKTDSQNSETTAPSGRELYRLQFSLPGGKSGKFWIYPRIYSTLSALYSSYEEVLPLGGKVWLQSEADHSLLGVLP